MALPSAYKANHQNNFRFDPIQTKHTSIMDGLMKIYGTWKAIPPEIRYKITHSDRDLNEAIANGSMNAAGEDATEVGAFRKWQEKNPDGTYEDYAKYKKAQELANFKDKWDIVNGKGEEKTTETTTTTDANGKTEGTTTETTKEEGEAPKEETYEWETSKGLPEDNGLGFLDGFDPRLSPYDTLPGAEKVDPTSFTAFNEGDRRDNTEGADYEMAARRAYEDSDEATVDDKMRMMGLNPDLDTDGYLKNTEDEDAMYYGDIDSFGDGKTWETMLSHYDDAHTPDDEEWEKYPNKKGAIKD